MFHLYEDVTNAGEGLQNLGLCSALRAFKQGGIYIVPHLLWHGGSVLPVSSEGPPHSVASYDTQGNEDDLFLSCFSRHKCPILTAVTYVYKLAYKSMSKQNIQVL
jgi:hypothetical protein